MALLTGLQDEEKAAKEGGAEPLHNILYTDLFLLRWWIPESVYPQRNALFGTVGRCERVGNPAL